MAEQAVSQALGTIIGGLVLILLAEAFGVISKLRWYDALYILVVLALLITLLALWLTPSYRLRAALEDNDSRGPGFHSRAAELDALEVMTQRFEARVAGVEAEIERRKRDDAI